MARYDLTDFEWRVIEPLLPNKPRGVPRVDDRSILNGIFYILRSGSPWRDVPERYDPPTTVYNRFNRWRKAGIWDRLMDRGERFDGAPEDYLRWLAEGAHDLSEDVRFSARYWLSQRGTPDPNVGALTDG
jgi:transposase